jgi:hypothetical protein
MNRTEAKQLIESPILKAFIEGKEIERICGDEWIDRSENIDADHLAMNPHTYRIKPEPREFWVNVYPHGVDNIIHYTKVDADNWAANDREECIKVREVI